MLLTIVYKTFEQILKCINSILITTLKIQKKLGVGKMKEDY